MKIMLADSSCSEQLCDLSATVSVPGSMEIAYLRHPDYFAALKIQGERHQTIVGMKDGQVCGSGSRSVRELFLNGTPTALGYLSGLRVHPDYRRSVFLARGYQYLKALHHEDVLPFYLTTIIEDNKTALKALSGGRAGLPTYAPIGRLITSTILFHRHQRRASASLRIERGSQALLPDIVSFLNREGGKKQFFPHYKVEDFGGPLFHDFRVEDWYVAYGSMDKRSVAPDRPRPSDQIVGVIGVWDQRGFKSYQIKSYSQPLRSLRPIVNVALSLVGYRPLPPPQRNLQLLHAVSPVVQGNDPMILRQLLSGVLYDRRRSVYSGLVLGLMENDPLRDALKPYRKVDYASVLYGVFWEDGAANFQALDPKTVCHLEPAWL